MPRPKPWSVRFELSPDNADHVRLHDRLLAKATTSDASTWMRTVLIAALSPSKSSAAKLKSPPSRSAVATIPPSVADEFAVSPRETDDSEDEAPGDELRYENVDE